MSKQRYWQALVILLSVNGIIYWPLSLFDRALSHYSMIAVTLLFAALLAVRFSAKKHKAWLGVVIGPLCVSGIMFLHRRVDVGTGVLLYLVLAVSALAGLSDADETSDGI